MKKYKKINFGARGGNAKSLAYFAILFEMLLKNITAKKAALVSGGSLMFGMWACGYKPREIMIILKKLRYDFVMRTEKRVEKGSMPIKDKFLKGLWVAVMVKTLWGWNMIKLLNKHLSWEHVEKAGKVEKLYIGFTTRNEIKKGLSSWFFVAMKRMLSDDISINDCEKVWKNVKMFWASNDGIYTVNPKTRKFVKYSNDIIPLGVAVRAAIKNPVMNNFKIKIKGKKEKPFDLGIMNNESNLAFINDSKSSFYQFSCDMLPEKEFLKGDNTVSDYIFNLHRPTKECVVMPKREKAFLNFNDKEIEFEYSNQVESDFFK